MNFISKILSALLCLLLSGGILAQTVPSWFAGDPDREVLITNAAALNTEHLEFSPAFYQNGIVFISARNQGEALDKNINENFFELFYSEFDAEGQPTTPVNFSFMVNSRVHEGPVTFDKTGQTIYFTRNNLKKGKIKTDSKSKVRLKIYEAKKGNFDWKDFKELPFNSDDYSMAHPSLSPDGQQLFFSSDMPFGEGGMDLYVVTKNGEFWGEPVNLGPGINTEKNELFPFIHESGTLFFASNGHSGLGGLDLFSATNILGEWGQVSNLGAPFNSTEDDLGLILNAGGESGFFSSARLEGLGKDDIYRFEIKTDSPMQEPILANIKVFNAVSGAAIEGANIRIIKQSDYGLQPEEEFYDVILVPSKEDPSELTLKLNRKNPEDIDLPQISTDSIGTAQATLKPAKLYSLIVNKEGYKEYEDVFSTRFQTKTKDFSVALDPQKCAPLVLRIQNEKNQQPVPNAVVSLKKTCNGELLDFLSNSNGQIEYCAPPNCVMSLSVKKEGFVAVERSIQSSIPGQSYGMDIVLQPVGKAPEPIPAGTVLVLENIYYDFNKSYIRSGAAEELDALLELLKKYPSMKIELVSHTDSRGGSRYNLQLSKKRALAAKNYLVSRGITPDRIQASGRGESQPRNHCIDGAKCSETEYQFNRRTEVKVISINESVRIQYGEK